MVSVPSKTPTLTAPSRSLIDRSSMDSTKGGKLESLNLDGKTGKFQFEDFLEKVKAIPFKGSSEILSIMQKEAGNWTLSDFNGLLMALVTADEPDLALELFANVASCGLTLAPNCWTFSIMIRCYCKKNDLDEAQRILHDMMENGK
ncbi:hypothetical protein CCACVL1_00100 [Corchorus capsularis]|uniref:Pentatricopeptide repeat-containing protein n=1 Tax=Corchorus capsularis TaxID=210143 RepID=A0A1R3KYK4_COCAP|nr:hypothetical protein CCACVL1_00100 [Corchorus capsularis]